MLILEKRQCTVATTMRRFGRLIEIRGTGLLRASAMMAVIVASGIGLAHGTPNRAQAPTQSTATNPPAYKFEVATIKPIHPTGGRGGIGGFFGENTFRANDWSLKAVIRFAYEVPIGMNDMLSGGPDWLDSERYDVTAKMDAATADQLKKLS